MHVVILHDNGTRQTQSYPRYLMEQHLGRKLETWEQVDHIDEDPTNNSVDNFQILTVAENNRKSNVGRPSPLQGREKGFTHGTVYGWMKKKCQCGLCQKHKASWSDTRNAKRRAGVAK